MVLQLSDNARTVLEKRYLLKDETPEDMFWRVARHIASAEEKDQELWAENIYDDMTSGRFIFNTPTLFNAGTEKNGCLSACFVIDLQDTRESISHAVEAQIKTLAYGGGTGFSLSLLRPKNDKISGIHANACGPVSVLKLLNQASKTITQNGIRQGANMAVLSVHHPDILEFITCKNDDPDNMSHFNISVAVTDVFMRAVNDDLSYELINPRNGAIVGMLEARQVMRAIAEGTWRTGDPGVVMLDRINEPKSHPLLDHLGPIIAVNPCGEQALSAWESCNLGHINLAKYISANKMFMIGDFQRDITRYVRYLDNVVTVNRFAMPEQAEMNKQTRRIGLGVMGLHDALIALSIPYESERALQFAELVAENLRSAADYASIQLGEERGVYEAWELSDHSISNQKFRNAWRLSIAPTGTVSIIAGCSSGIEPWFSMAHTRTMYGGTELSEINSDLMETLVNRGWDEDRITQLTEVLLDGESLQNPDLDIDADIRELFKSALDISPEFHIRMQAVWQQHIDNGISKSINVPENTTVEEIEDSYIRMWELGCKGGTIYRDKSRNNQVLATSKPVAVHQNGHSPNTRQRLPDERSAVNHKFKVGDQEGYITVGLYDDGSPGEVFLKVSKEGSTIAGLMDTVAILTSIALQYQVPLEVITNKLTGIRFEPSGMTRNPDIPNGVSIIDYVYRWMHQRFGNGKSVASVAGLYCPDCSSELVFQEGCLKCSGTDCGFSKCG